MNTEPFRQEIVAAARRWVGTAYVNQASTCGQGTDCLGLIRGVWREVVGEEPEKMPYYSPYWGEVSGNEAMMEAAHRWFDVIDVKNMGSGDMVLFRWKDAAVARHAGILTGQNRFIHAYEKAGVVETTLGSQWHRRIVAAYRFPSPSNNG